MDKTAKFLMSVVFDTINTIYMAWITITLTEWFVPQILDHIKLNIPIVIGLMLIVDMILYSSTKTRQMAEYVDENIKTTNDKIAHFISYKMVMPSLIMFIGYITKQFL